LECITPHYIKFTKALLRVYCERIIALAAPGKPCLSIYFPPLCFNFRAMIAAIIMTNIGFLFGAVVGYAIKKVMKIAAVVVGLFVAGLAYLS
jgi:hypothetical protein